MARAGTGATKGRQITYEQVLNWLLTTYSTYSNVSCANQEVRLMNQGTMDQLQYANTLNVKALVCENAYL